MTISHTNIDITDIFDIKLYHPQYFELWNDFIDNRAKNGHFMFNRNYMEYHKMRFSDHSILIFHKKKLVAVMPAHCIENTLYSHQGLSFGGLILHKKISTPLSISVFGVLIAFLKQHNIKKWVYRPIPYIYATMPAQEDLYCLQQVHAKILERSLCAVIDLKTDYKWASGNKRHLKKGFIQNLKVVESSDLKTFFNILTTILKQKYNTQPVHKLSELVYLRTKFPNNIKLYMAYNQEQALGGVLLFITPYALHTQYIAISDLGKTFGTLECVIKHIIEEFEGHRYLSLGTSNWPKTGLLNEKLLDNKERFGARSIIIDTYEIDL